MVRPLKKQDSIKMPVQVVDIAQEEEAAQESTPQEEEPAQEEPQQEEAPAPKRRGRPLALQLTFES